MNYQYKSFRHKLLPGIFLMALGWSACSVDPILDPNNPSTSGLTQNASIGELQNLVVGMEGAMRNNLNNYFDGVSVIGREYYRFSTSDPRLTSDLLGKGSARSITTRFIPPTRSMQGIAW
jgi:hypothetical protein